VGPSADIYSLSVIVYQMFCGCLPFEAASLQELLKKQIEELPTAPAERIRAFRSASLKPSWAVFRRFPRHVRPPQWGLQPNACRLRRRIEVDCRWQACRQQLWELLLSTAASMFLPRRFRSWAGCIWLLNALSGRTAVPEGLLVVVLQVFLFERLFSRRRCIRLARRCC